MVELFHICQEYQTGKPVLSDVSFRLEKGEFVYLTGASGAGKSTLLKLIFCEINPSSGQIIIMDRNLASMATDEIPYLRRRIGVVFQDFRLLRHRTVAENIALPLEVLNRPRWEIEKKVFFMLKKVGILHRAKAFPEELSGGEQQRVAIARALIVEPLLLMADEPTGNLDEDTTRDILHLFEEANASGTTLLLATHDRRLFENTGRRVIRLEQGRAVFDSHMKLDRPSAPSLENGPGGGA